MNAESDKDNNNHQNSDPYLYYCLCGKLSLIIEKSFEQLPIRNYDDSIVIDDILTYKIYAMDDKTIYIQRDEKYEQRLNKICEKCKLTLFYKTTSPKSCIFALKGSLIEKDINGGDKSTLINYPNKNITTRHTKEVGRYGFVTISTLDESEYNDIDIKDISSSYSINAKIINSHLKKKRSINNDTNKITQDQNDRILFKKPKGTL